jgi:hypothetical protein
MMSDRFSRACLLAIVLLLAVIALRPWFEVRHARAAEHSQYMVIQAYPSNLKYYNETMKKYTDDGWEFVAAPAYARNGEPDGLLIFRK